MKNMTREEATASAFGQSANWPTQMGSRFLRAMNFALLIQARFLAKDRGGAQKCAAHSLHRLTQTKTGRDDQSRQPIRRWWSDRSKGRACMGDKVGARTEQTSSRIGTWSGQHRSGIRMEKVNTPSHPAAAMESCK